VRDLPPIPGAFLRSEGAVAVGLALLLYWRDGSSWWLFAVLLFVPDIGMLGYVAGPRLGAVLYDIFHTYALAVPLTAYGYLADRRIALAVGLIWTAHIGMDRMLGYGLKLTSGFKDTHLGRLRAGRNGGGR
jgi:hypothetical protein